MNFHSAGLLRDDRFLALPIRRIRDSLLEGGGLRTLYDDLVLRTRSDLIRLDSIGANVLFRDPHLDTLARLLKAFGATLALDDGQQ